ncbi:DISARM system helicase DrmA [Methylotuvimicrobium buryatense]|uniref:Helicase n=1 Tax=Methylotuvimicrobium buryatense TaxID=95641 RepID=A0A4P9ULM4_METBY|nr:DISARM system helicase DrmA [Methylotuvimicrobium buryatense]QCW81041.1 helicase [Methylotuvimicrobium buryatense]
MTEINAWIAVDKGLAVDPILAPYVLLLDGERSLYRSIYEDDWLLIVDDSQVITKVARIMRIRSDLETTTLYFDRSLVLDEKIPLTDTSFSLPGSGTVGRLQWTDFIEGMTNVLKTRLEDIPVIGSGEGARERAYIRELLQLAVMDDLLGPADGPHEKIVDMSVRDRYLVGKLAPRQAPTDTENWEGSLVDEDEEESVDTSLPGQHEPGAEFAGTTGRVEPESDSTDEIDASSNQSLIPSSMGFTFCVTGDASAIEVDVGFGRYERLSGEDGGQTKVINRKVRDADGNVVRVEQEEVRAKVWQRIPCGGKLILPLTTGTIAHQAPDPEQPEVRIQGSIRAPNANGDRLVTLFLVNAQVEPETNRDSAWLFQPEMIIRAAPKSSNRAIFRRRPMLDANGMDPEREALEMIYRNRVEFSVGHGVAVHANLSDDVTLATEIRTVIMPQYEVAVTETPGEDPADRSAMRKMLENGWLDMHTLATLEKSELSLALRVLTDDYAEWIHEQRVRIGQDVIGHDHQAHQTLDRCHEVLVRLRQGIDTLETNDKALAAFRFANRAMATQRVRSIYSLAMRRKEDLSLASTDISGNRSWRPFQLAFLLLSIPSLTDPKHQGRTRPVEAYADLLWFPTGGGKTEAYLGVAAFTMAIRRMQPNLGGYDSSRGLAVIMRYTLRLLTLQQFQRATTLICAMDVLRREALDKGDESLGKEPFTIGLWVGNKVTPGTTQDSHRAIEARRNPGQNTTGLASPAQLTSCPWCGSEIAPGRDIEVDRDTLRTVIYCGDKKGQCEFSKGKSSKRTHPGIPVLVVDEEIYHRPPTMMISTVDKFAMMAWRGEVRTLFGRADRECPRHGLVLPDADCHGSHQAKKSLPAVKVKTISPIRPPDLIIQDEFHLISGPLGTMVGLYETAVDELSAWQLDGLTVRPKIIASTATVRKAREQVNNVFMRQVAVFPPHGLDVEDNFFSIQRPIQDRPGRRYLGVCSPGSSRPAMLIRVYTAFLTAGQTLFERFGSAADPYMTMVGYFNSLRELGGMKRLAEDDVQTRSYRVQMSLVKRPGLGQRGVNNIRELTSRVSSQDIPKYLDQLEVKFNTEYDAEKGKYVCRWQDGDVRAIDVVLATNMLSVGVDVNRLGLMAVNGQPKGTAEYIQATSRVGRASPGLVCTVLTWARPRDLSHYETFEHYHATFYKHVEAQSVTPFSPRAMDRGLTGAMLSVMRLSHEAFSPNVGAGHLEQANQSEVTKVIEVLAARAGNVEDNTKKQLAIDGLKARADDWAKEASLGGRTLAYEKRGQQKDTTVALIKSPGLRAWDNWTVPMSMREVEPGVRLIMNTSRLEDEYEWRPRSTVTERDEEDEG